VLTTALNLSYSRASTQIDPASAVISVSPNVSYRFSNNVTGGVGVDYKRTSGGRLGQVHQSIDVRVDAEFKF
jgi:long-subunit fatty acid transport protein